MANNPNQGEYKLPNNDKINSAHAPDEHVNASSAYESYHNTPVGDYEALAIGPPAQDNAARETTEDDPYHVPAYFDLSEPTTDAYAQKKEEVKLEFDPPLRHYAELRGGLPIGYVWIPPSSPEPIQREATPEQDPAFVTPLRPARTMATTKKRKKTVTFALSPQEPRKKRKRATTVKYQARFTSPLSEEFSDAPDGLLTPEPREFVLRRR
jgi:hypothetical protein